MLQKGYRKTTVDGWGTIVTPFFSQPVDCIRLRSEIHEIDTISTSIPIPFQIGIPRNTVEYKWLAKNEHYPVLWITTTLVAGNETVTAVRYRDYYRPGLLNVANNSITSSLIAYPNPSVDGKVTITIPADWKEYTIEVYDMQSRKVLSANNTPSLNMQELSKGNYLGVVNHNGAADFVVLTR
jgi:hypothetical protein